MLPVFGAEIRVDDEGPADVVQLLITGAGDQRLDTGRRQPHAVDIVVGAAGLKSKGHYPCQLYELGLLMIASWLRGKGGHYK